MEKRFAAVFITDNGQKEAAEIMPIDKTTVIDVLDQAGARVLEAASGGDVEYASTLSKEAIFEAGLLMGMSLALKLPHVPEIIIDEESLRKVRQVIQGIEARHVTQ